MAVRYIVKHPDPVLREVARPVKSVTPQVLRLLDDLAETMRHAEGVGLAAPQVGISRRLAVVDVGDGLIELINPEILAEEGEEVGVEGCLSIPGVYGEVRRAARVRVRTWTRTGESAVIEAEGLKARAIQHEIDHLDGILFIDRALSLTHAEETRADVHA
ncbi:MAG: Peptide deformylase [Brockia lithotrophica]|uniref:Peptide deformylase n=1 Tax=Brockia lithotrophica TaxID=933949 RepID=A0A2T5G6C6_9BACL|nr:peptide deformylase [Brockia lithotrophica]PTQ51747.1 MAG: Peptide deformylase [Brockia lithotrophica]